MKQKAIRLLVLALVALLAATTVASAQEEAEANLWQTIQNEPRLDNFELLVDAAVLDDNLSQDGPFTIFAPTNEAMATFNSVVESSEANGTEVLLYHVINGYYDADAVAAHDSFTTLLGDHLEVSADNGSFVLDGTAQVVESNIVASNGVIHLIDTVLAPELESEEETGGDEAATEDAATGDDETAGQEAEDETVTEEEAPDGTATVSNFLQGDDRFTVLYDLLNQGNLLATLENRSDFTLFAPTDDAFAELPAERLEELMEDEDALSTFLLHHVVGDSLTGDQIATDDFIPTLSGGALIVGTEDGTTVNGANFVETGIQLANGTLHVIDTVLNP